MGIILAIDPGKSGGLAWWDGEVTTCAKMPDTEGDVTALLKTIMAREGVQVVMESVRGHIGGEGRPGKIMFTFGRGFGFILGVCSAWEKPIRLVSPEVWMKSTGCGTRGKSSSQEWKNKLKAEAQRRYPSHKVTLATADALLLLDWAKEKHAQK